jgi:hypothetical protein
MGHPFLRVVQAIRRTASTATAADRSVRPTRAWCPNPSPHEKFFRKAIFEDRGLPRTTLWFIRPIKPSQAGVRCIPDLVWRPLGPTR